jgi:hypothetical protein
MPDGTVYGGKLQRIRSGGGSVIVTITSNVGQGNGGTSLPCAGCWVSAELANTGHINMNIGVAATDALGIELAEADAGGPLWVPIDDVSKLYFYGASDNDVIHITYLAG